MNELNFNGHLYSSTGLAYEKFKQMFRASRIGRALKLAIKNS